MKINASDIIGFNGASMNVEAEKLMDGVEMVPNSFFDKKICFSGTLTNRDALLKLNGRLVTGYRSLCSRCLEPLERKLKLTINENFSGAAMDEQIDIHPLDGNILDMTKVINDNIILGLPLRELCFEGCKGLCAKCGINLNKESCSCNGEDIDPRLESLKKFFNNK